MVICTDKTGTLTQNEMTVQRLCRRRRVARERRGVRAGGWIVPGRHRPRARSCSPDCSATTRRSPETDGHFEAAGDPTEAALLTSAAKAGLDRAAQQQALPRLDAIPFESQPTQYMATLHDAGDGRRVVYLKGAVEKVLERCIGGGARPASRPGWTPPAVTAEVDALRPTARASSPSPAACVPHGADHLAHKDVAGGLTFLGLQAMMHSPSPGGGRRRSRRATTPGIGAEMITGDHAVTAAAIARERHRRRRRRGA